MDFRIIKSPSKGTKEIILRRAAISGLSKELGVADFDAIGLVQGKVIDMLCAADIAEKAVGIDVLDIRGVCPQHMTVLAVIGDTASVENALTEIEDKLKGGAYSDYGQIGR